MIIKKVERGIFDVFFGMGWENWTRIKVDFQDGKFVRLGGKKMPTDVFKNFKDIMAKKKAAAERRNWSVNKKYV